MKRVMCERKCEKCERCSCQAREIQPEIQPQLMGKIVGAVFGLIFFIHMLLIEILIKCKTKKEYIKMMNDPEKRKQMEQVLKQAIFEMMMGGGRIGEETD